jgi:lysyl-tRNA synthetase class II
MLPETQLYVARADISKEKPTLTSPLAKPRQNAKAVFKIYELFVYGYTYYITHTFCENVLKIAKPKARLRAAISNKFSLVY